MSAIYTDNDRIDEVIAIRADFVDRYVQRRADAREGDFTTAECEAWTNDAFRLWRERHPALSSLLPSHLPAEEPA